MMHGAFVDNNVIVEIYLSRGVGNDRLDGLPPIIVLKRKLRNADFKCPPKMSPISMRKIRVNGCPPKSGPISMRKIKVNSAQNRMISGKFGWRQVC
jgi:hypothetical protein